MTSARYAYFQRPDADNPAYVEFRVGADYGHEFGVIDRTFLPPVSQQGGGGTIVRWHVDDIGAAVGRLKRLGAKDHEAITERGGGFVTASVIDPFGNVLGLITQSALSRAFTAATNACRALA